VRPFRRRQTAADGGARLCGCGREQAERERGWQGHLVDLDEDGVDEVAFFCPRCAAREFGGIARDDSG
jgi:hypothetical protein